MRAGLGLVEPGGSTQLGVECVLHKAGLVSLQGIHCTDTLLNRWATLLIFHPPPIAHSCSSAAVFSFSI